LKKALNVQDEFSKHFVGGMVGFKNGTGRKKWEQSLERELRQFKELREVEAKIDRLKNPIVRVKSAEVSPSEFEVGEEVLHLGAGQMVEVTRINKKSVSIKWSGGFKESVKANLLRGYKK
jgi:hypothetical protein